MKTVKTIALIALSLSSMAAEAALGKGLARLGGAVVGAASGRALADTMSDSKFDSYMEKEIQKLESTLPRMIDTDTKLYAVEYLPYSNTAVSYHTIVNYNINELNAVKDYVEVEFSKMLHQNNCKYAIKSGANFQYTYKSSDNKQYLSITVKPENCAAY